MTWKMNLWKSARNACIFCNLDYNGRILIYPHFGIFKPKCGIYYFNLALNTLKQLLVL